MKKSKSKEELIFLAIIFVGYCLGRLGHLIGGKDVGFHHWILAVLMIIVAFYMKKNKFLMALGIGLFISDLRDFLSFKIYSADEVISWTFWGFD